MKNSLLLFFVLSILSCEGVNNQQSQKETSNQYSKLEITETARLVNEAQKYRDLATGIINSSDSLYINSSDSKKYIEYLKESLKTAKEVNTKILNDVRIGYGDVYNQKFIKGLELEIKGADSINSKLSLKGQVLYDDYIDWLIENGLK